MDMYLNTAVKRLFYLWVSFAVFLILVVFLQTILGKYGDSANAAWWWLVLCVVPGNLLICFSYYRNKRLSSQLDGTERLIFTIAYYLSGFYLIAVVSGLLLQPFSNPERSEADNLRATEPGLLLFQFLVMLTFGLFFYKTQKRPSPVPDPVPPDGKIHVFISYNHANKDVAEELKNLLETEGIKVIIDHESMRAGEDIHAFITESIRKSHITLAIISRESLLSGWVSMETIETFSLERFSSQKRFIACYLDEDFLDLSFTSKGTQSLDLKLEKINQLLDTHSQLNIDTRDLNEEKSRLISLRNNLDDIINRLRTSLCIDIRKEKFQETFPKLLQSIKTNEVQTITD